ncbi:MAG: hypothetical protein HQ488_04695 [Parcubacteria group bacterium]|nr:hypothetical protein [Parcubacteria group bacterium]
MSFFKTLGLKTGLLVETKGGGDTPELSAEDLAAAMNQLEAELAPPTMPPVTTPAPLGAEIVQMDPEEIIRLVDDEIAAAAAPAFSLWRQLDAQFAPGLPDSGQRAMIVAGAMQTTQGFTPGHVLWDIAEARQACADIRQEVEAGRDGAIEEQVGELEASVLDKRARAQVMEMEIAQLRREAQIEEAEAQSRRAAIGQAVEASMAHIAQRDAGLMAADAFVRGQHPDATPEEPPGNNP